jgi:hypothetical protein
MDEKVGQEVESGEEPSGKYRLRFRYELWSQASQGFRSPAVFKRFPAMLVDRTASALNSSTAEPNIGSGSDGLADRRNFR